MKAHITAAFVAACGIACTAQAKPLGATIYNPQGQPTAGFAVEVTAEGLRFSIDESGGAAVIKPFAQISKIELRQPEGWSEAMDLYNAGQFPAAETAFATLSTDYAPLGMVQDQFGAKARYYLLQCLRANGKFEQLANVLEITSTSAPIALNAHYSEDVAFLNGWALAGKQDWAAVTAFVGQYEDPGSQGGAPRVPFRKDLSQGRVAELAFLRGLALANTAGEEGEAAALEDLTRAAVLNFGSDKTLTTQAIDQALALLTDVPEEAETMRREAHALATIRRDVLGAGDIDAKYLPLLNINDLPELGGGGGDEEPAGEEAPEDAPAAEEGAEGDGAGEAAPDAADAAAEAPAEAGDE